MTATYGERSLVEHKKYRGKVAINSTVPLANADDLSVYYSP